MSSLEQTPYEPYKRYLLEIAYDGTIQETYPARLPTVYRIRVIEAADAASPSLRASIPCPTATL